LKTLEQKIRDHSAVVGVMGLGYVGLPLAVEFAEEGFKVIGFDTSKEKCKLISSGKSDIADVSSERVRTQIKIKKLVATNDFSKMKQVDCVAICVPTPLSKTKDPDVTFILSAVKYVKEYLHKGMLVVLESTTYPGTRESIRAMRSMGRKTRLELWAAQPPNVAKSQSSFTNR
jgi:UDP-N-acetyl-D-glucosamine dehydrogenase